MISVTHGDILISRCDAVVNPVNCVGVMGAGLALRFKAQYPYYYLDYQEKCASGALCVGTVGVYGLGSYHAPSYVISFPTKRHWRETSTLEIIQSGLPALLAAATELGLQTLAIPAVGCGLGGLRWDTVRPLLEETFEDIDTIDVFLYAPQ